MAYAKDLAGLAAIALLRLLRHLPTRVLFAVGRGCGRLLHAVAGDWRRTALRNVELCLAQMPPAQRRALVREHFALLGRSFVALALLWYAPRERLERLIRIEGQPATLTADGRPVMWLLPHFLGLEVAGVALQFAQPRPFVSHYRRQSNAVIDAELRRGRMRFGRCEVYPRATAVRVLLRRVREGCALVILPDQDFGERDSVFAPFLGVDAATLTAPARIARLLDMVVQPVVVEMLPGAQGWCVRLLLPLQGWPGGDDVADAAAMNAVIAREVERVPAQYLWVHRRFKTRPPGTPDRYADPRG
jgi:KDO2-lipid IV(A) lauroyltransferase